MSESRLTPNRLAFLGLSNEYCHAVENAAETDLHEFTDSMLRLLPRIYISATDLPEPAFATDSEYLANALEEEVYDAVRRDLEMLFGEHDTYLEVFEEDMKYSDTPIAASISEGLADIFQVLYNLLETVKDAPEEVIIQSLDTVKDDFGAYWSRPLCNVLRAINALKYNE